LSHRENIEMIKAVCRIYDAVGEKKKILKWMDHSKNIAAADPELLEIQARTYASMNQIETARAKYMSLAEIYKSEGRTEEALNVYAEIIMLLPAGGEKMYKMAEDLGEGAAEKLKAIIEKRRKELDDADKKREEEKRKTEDDKRKAEEEAKKPKAAAPKVEARQAPAPPPPVAEVANIKQADSAFDLGNVYLKMGLKDEAKSEFLKSRKIYEEIKAKGGKDEPRAGQRLNLIETLLKGKETPKAEVKVEVKAKAEVKIGAEKKTEVKKEKKISFV